MSNHDEKWHRRHAIQLAAQLPEHPEDALAVLRYATELVEQFLAPSYPQEAQGRPVVAFRRTGASSPRERAISSVSPSALPK